MTEPYVSIVSGTYQRIAHLKLMIGSVRDSIGLGIPYEIVIVDGGSTDGTIEWLKDQADVILIEQGELLGAVKAFNAGFARAHGKYVIIANDDIQFMYEGIQRAIALMDDNPDWGIGCFHQNRHTKEYTIEMMPVVIGGVQGRGVYGQVCIIPRWLGDRVGWWGNSYHTYGGDNELSCQVIELGFHVKAMDMCCINDFIVNDELRRINHPNGKGEHSDSKIWHKRWDRDDGLKGPIFSGIPKVQNSGTRMPRLLYAPLYEDEQFPIQLASKSGLREALAKHYLVTEVNYRRSPELLYYECLMFEPDICLFQYHDPRVLSYDLMMKLKDEFPDILFISWNGDFNEKLLRSAAYIQVAKLFDIGTYVVANLAHQYVTAGVNFKYWQIGYEDYVPALDDAIEKDKYDVVFMGNCYNPVRQVMGEFLRTIEDLKVGLFGHWPSHVGSDGVSQYDFVKGDALYRSSKIALGDNLYPDSVAYISNRIFQVLRSGSFMLQQRFKGMEDFLGFEDGVHLIIWNDFDDLYEKIQYWLDRPEERARIARAGKEFVIRNHSFDVRVDELRSIIEEYRQH